MAMVLFCIPSICEGISPITDLLSNNMICSITLFPQALEVNNKIYCALYHHLLSKDWLKLLGQWMSSNCLFSLVHFFNFEGLFAPLSFLVAKDPTFPFFL